MLSEIEHFCLLVAHLDILFFQSMFTFLLGFLLCDDLQKILITANIFSTCTLVFLFIHLSCFLMNTNSSFLVHIWLPGATGSATADSTNGRAGTVFTSHG